MKAVSLKRKLLNFAMAMVMAVAGVAGYMPGKANAIEAEPDMTGSITVHKYQYDQLPSPPVVGTGLEQVVPEGGTPLAGVTYEIVQTHTIDDNGNVVALASPGTPVAITTGEDGIADFAGLPLGRYALRETAVPEGVVMDMTTYQIDVPLFDNEGNIVDGDTDAAGVQPVYDVHVYPKNPTDTNAKTQGTSPENMQIYDENNAMPVTIGTPYYYQITATAPSDMNMEPPYGKFDITDSLDARLDYIDGSAAVKVTDAGGVEKGFALGTDYTVDYADHVLAVSLTAAGIAKLDPADKVIATFQASVNSAEGSTPTIPNHATISYTNGSNTTKDKDTNTTHTETPGTVALKKVDSVMKNALEGAKFQIYAATADGTAPDTSKPYGGGADY